MKRLQIHTGETCNCCCLNMPRGSGLPCKSVRTDFFIRKVEKVSVSCILEQLFDRTAAVVIRKFDDGFAHM